MIKRFPALAILLACAAPCLGKDLPSYDIALHCKASTAMFGDSQKLIMDSCIELEQKTKKQISSRLDVFDDQTLRRCDALAAMGAGGSYQVFSGCLSLDVANRFLEGQIDVVPARK
jgi:hypothetical protein